MSTSRAVETATSDVTIRHCKTLEEWEACVQLESEVWNFGDRDLVPSSIFVVADKVGGHAIGAFKERTLVGFVLAVPGIRNGHPYLHSHMLAVAADYRNRGIGYRLKLAQRADALGRGIGLIEWTFDPLEIKNACLNIGRLGAIARRYNVNQYGAMSSPLQGSLPSDRLVAEWWLNSARVQKVLSDGCIPAFTTESTIEVPSEVAAWKASASERPKARAAQLQVRVAFLTAFSRGLAVLGYERDSKGNGKFLLARWDEGPSYRRL